MPNCLTRRSCNVGVHKPMKEKNVPFQHINKLILICSFYNYWCVWHCTIENQHLKLEGPNITWGWGCVVVEWWMRQQTDKQLAHGKPGSAVPLFQNTGARAIWVSCHNHRNMVTTLYFCFAYWLLFLFSLVSCLCILFLVSHSTISTKLNLFSLTYYCITFLSYFIQLHLYFIPVGKWSFIY